VCVVEGALANLAVEVYPLELILEPVDIGVFERFQCLVEGNEVLIEVIS
jgi:hypothetical protein